MTCADSDSTISMSYENTLGGNCTNMPSGAVFTCDAGTWKWNIGKVTRRVAEVNCINLNG